MKGDPHSEEIFLGELCEGILLSLFQGTSPTAQYTASIVPCIDHIFYTYQEYKMSNKESVRKIGFENFETIKKFNLKIEIKIHKQKF